MAPGRDPRSWATRLTPPRGKSRPSRVESSKSRYILLLCDVSLSRICIRDKVERNSRVIPHAQSSMDLNMCCSQYLFSVPIKALQILKIDHASSRRDLFLHPATYQHTENISFGLRVHETLFIFQFVYGLHFQH